MFWMVHRFEDIEELFKKNANKGYYSEGFLRENTAKKSYREIIKKLVFLSLIVLPR